MAKVCSTCKIPKDIDEFSINRSNKDGHQYNCKKCTNICSEKYRKSHTGWKSKHNKRHYLSHREEISNQRKQKRLLRKGKVFAESQPDKEETTKSLKANRDKIAASIKLFYLNQNKEAAR